MGIATGIADKTAVHAVTGRTDYPGQTMELVSICCCMPMLQVWWSSLSRALDPHFCNTWAPWQVMSHPNLPPATLSHRLTSQGLSARLCLPTAAACMRMSCLCILMADAQLAYKGTCIFHSDALCRPLLPPCSLSWLLQREV